ncbi:hypothetical protein FZD47_20310 [Bacillus infantis]|uniref:Alcohol dehydrogenase-like C-terminal domain-containing protein n=1 Tax=Bacillus infantis TaxID=324767 RepID=A0A5D4SE13_9BACI|nr:hypothetical protein [Bacillus infantis]TYS60558.1 hypothetical protein FZD47_20310 [Bacillus infantis]
MEREFSIVSMGTERETSSEGYMCVSKYDKIRNIRLLAPESHKCKNIGTEGDHLIIKGDVPINILTISRFQLIAALALPKWIPFNSKVSVIGGGPIGIAMCFELIRRNYKEPKLWTRRPSLLSNFRLPVDFSLGWDSLADVYIDCTGQREVIKKIIANAQPHSIIVLAGTPRDKLEVEILDIHRKNITFSGGHELTGWNSIDRQKTIDNIINWHVDKKYNLDTLIKRHIGTSNKDHILNHFYNEPFHIMF